MGWELPTSSRETLPLSRAPPGAANGGASSTLVPGAKEYGLPGAATMSSPLVPKRWPVKLTTRSARPGLPEPLPWTDRRNKLVKTLEGGPLISTYSYGASWEPGGLTFASLNSTTLGSSTVTDTGRTIVSSGERVG